MDPWCSSLLSAFARDLVCGVADQLRYPCCFNGFVDDLQGVQDKLIPTINSVSDRVEHAEKQAMRTDQVIHDWLKNANTLKDNVAGELNEAGTKRTCCFGRFPSCIWRYRVAKKLAKSKEEVQMCIDEGDKYKQPERVASLPVDMQQYLQRKKCQEFESREGAYKQLIEALEDDKVTMFGIWGMGGSGKTTMAKELKRIAEEKHLFDKVISVAVSSNAVLREIQDKIASALQFHFPEDGESERVLRLCKRLIDEKRTLVILDDVWQILDLDKIGIPDDDKNDNRNFFCKVLITTRDKNVCDQMDCKTTIYLSNLTNVEAWELFKKGAHICDDTPKTLQDVGRNISDECNGLPIAIAALAGTLKGKTEAEWKIALDRLKNSIPVDIQRGLENPYKCLEVSYDNLDNNEAKSLFLLCSVFPEDYEIPVEILTIVAIGLGLVGREDQSFEMARNAVIASKNKLVSSSLLSLVHGYSGVEHVKMHDLIRDIALWKARKEDKEIQCLLKEDVTLECNKSSIRYMRCKKVPNDLDYSRLEFLWLNTHLEVSDEIFKGMGRLRVLCLEYSEILTGSLSTMSFLKWLANLRFLYLSKWKIGDMSSLGDLTKLESLMLIDCSFFELPDVVVTQLTKLKLLSLSRCTMERKPFKVVERLVQLEELYYVPQARHSVNYGHFAFFYGDDAEFFITFPQSLQRYIIELGSRLMDFKFRNSQRSLWLSCLYTSNTAMVELAKKAEVLIIEKIVGGARNMIPDIIQKESWVDLYLRDSDLECLVDTARIEHSMEVVVFSKLRWLRIDNMYDLGALYHGVLPRGLFEKLEKLHIRYCPALTSLLTLAAARSMVHLQELQILNCGGLEHVLLEDDYREPDISRQDDNKLVFSKLRSLCIRGCHELKNTIPLTFSHGLVQLERLDISGVSLEYVFRHGMHVDRDVEDNNALNIELPNLKLINLESNSNMISIFPPNCSAVCPSLQTVRLDNCSKFDTTCVNTFQKDRSIREYYFY